MSCGSDTGFSKALKFGALPQVLCIHLKRFRWRTAARGGKQKVDTHVKFPMEGLEMERWIGGDITSPSLYDLYAVVVHQGSGYARSLVPPIYIMLRLELVQIPGTTMRSPSFRTSGIA